MAVASNPVLPLSFIDLLLPTVQYSASIVDINPTATTLVFNCGTQQQCYVKDARLTVGPWAQITPPPGVSTGTFDATLTDNPNMYGVESTGSWSDVIASRARTQEPSSYHCDMTSAAGSGLTAKACTYPGLRGQVTATGLKAFEFGLMPFTITAGAEKLAAVSVQTVPAIAAVTSVGAGTTVTGTRTSTGTASVTNASRTSATGPATGSAERSTAASRWLWSPMTLLLALLL